MSVGLTADPSLAVAAEPPCCTAACLGEHLNAIYVAMLLSGGMPITYISAAFWFVSSYWCDKVELLTLSRRPITYGSDLSDMVMNLLPYAAVSLTHSGFSFLQTWSWPS